MCLCSREGMYQEANLTLTFLLSGSHSEATTPTHPLDLSPAKYRLACNIACNTKLDRSHAYVYNAQATSERESEVMQAIKMLLR